MKLTFKNEDLSQDKVTQSLNPAEMHSDVMFVSAVMDKTNGGIDRFTMSVKKTEGNVDYILNDSVLINTTARPMNGETPVEAEVRYSKELNSR